jgi:hypothetical protein
MVPFCISIHRFDLLFEDRHGQKLIVELQKGTLDREHHHKIQDYYEEYKVNHPKEFVDLMVIANRIPYERRRKLSYLGVEYREISESEFIKTDSGIEENNANVNIIDKGEKIAQSRVANGNSIKWSIENLRENYARYPDKDLAQLLQKTLDWAMSEGIFMTSPGGHPNFRLRSKSKSKQGLVTIHYNGVIQVYFNNIESIAERRTFFDEIMKINPLKKLDNIDNIRGSKDLIKGVQELSEAELKNLLLTFRKYCD